MRALLGASASRIDDLSSGRASYPTDLLFELPEREALELLRDLEDAVRSFAAVRRSA